MSLRFVLFWLAEDFESGARLFIGNRGNAEQFEEQVRKGERPYVAFGLIVDCRGGQKEENLTSPLDANCKRVAGVSPYSYNVARRIIIL